jgi:hypothetical protein
MALPFAKKPSSQYKQEPYYWRGGDVLREREYLTDEFKKALTEFRRADFELKKVESELQQASDCLHEREEYTAALANFLDSDAEGGHLESEYKKRLAALEDEIRHAEAELAEARAVHHPAVASGLQKEKAYLTIENQRTSKAIDLSEEQCESAKKQLAACTVSNKYRSALDLERKVLDLSRKKTYLRQAVNEKKKEFDATRPIAAPQTADARRERSALVPQVELDEAFGQIEEKKQRRPKKWEFRLLHLMQQIEELNDRLTDLGMTEDVVDTTALRQQHFSGQAGASTEEEEARD